MATRDQLVDWAYQALQALGGRGDIVQVCKHIWEQLESELRASGDLFYTWQYDMRWAGQKLRDTGKISEERGSKSIWYLN